MEPNQNGDVRYSVLMKMATGSTSLSEISNGILLPVSLDQHCQESTSNVLLGHSTCSYVVVAKFCRDLPRLKSGKGWASVRNGR